MLNFLLRLIGRRKTKRAMLQQGLRDVPLPVRFAGPLPIAAVFLWRNRARLRELYNQHIASRFQHRAYADA